MEDVPVADKKHPLADLLDDILAACRQLDGRRELLDQVRALIRSKQNAILTATSDHWQKKYDQEQKEKNELAAKYRSLKQAFDLLSTRALEPARPLPSFDALPPNSPARLKDRSRSFAASSFKRSALSTFKLSIEQPADDDQARRWDSERKPAAGPGQACPLCKQQLHPVFAELREAEQRAETLADILASMGRKGRELMSTNSQLGSELARQKQESAGLLEALKAMEAQVVRAVNEHARARRESAEVAERSRKEAEELRVKASELEARLALLHTEYYPGSPRTTAQRRNSLPVRDGVEWHGKLANLQLLPTLEIDESEAHSHRDSPPSLLTPVNRAQQPRPSQELSRAHRASALATSQKETDSTDPFDRRLLKPQLVPSQAGKRAAARLPPSQPAPPDTPATPSKAGGSSRQPNKSSLPPADRTLETHGRPTRPTQGATKAGPPASREDTLRKNLKVHPNSGYGCVLI